jgi:hypothetical protein
LGKHDFTTEALSTQRRRDVFSSIGRPAVAEAMAGQVPIDENNLSDQMHDRSIFHTLILEDLGLAIVFFDDRSTCSDLSASDVDYTQETIRV